MFSTHEMKYIWYSPKKSKFSFYFIPHRTYGSSNSNWYVKFQMFMSARAFWRVSYFAVFYKEYLNFSWYNLIEAYIFSISFTVTVYLSFYSVAWRQKQYAKVQTGECHMISEITDGRYGMTQTVDQRFMIRVY